MPVRLEEALQGLGMLGGVLALPRSAQAAQRDVELHRQMLQDTGIPQADIEAIYPNAPMQWLAPGAGVGGKILGGIGDVGALLSSIAGKPISAPRMGISELAQASKLRESHRQQQLTQRLGASETDPTAKLLLETGQLETYGRYKAALARGGGSYLTMRERLNRMAPDDPDRPALQKALEDYDKMHPAPAPPKTVAQIGEEERERQRIRDQVEGERREDVIRKNPQWTDEQKSHYRANGSLPAPERPEREKPVDFVRDIYNEVLKEHQAAARQVAHDEGPDARGATVDPEAVKRDAMQRARSFTAGGWKVANMPPDVPEPPRETGLGMSRGETEPPVVPPRAEMPTMTSTTTTTTMPPKASLGLGKVEVRTPETQEEIDFVNQINADIKSGKLPAHVGKARIIERLRVQ